MSHSNMATHVNACLGMVDSCVWSILMNVLQTLAKIMVSAEMGSIGTFVIAMLVSVVLSVRLMLTIVTRGEFFNLFLCKSVLKICFKNTVVQLVPEVFVSYKFFSITIMYCTIKFITVRHCTKCMGKVKRTISRPLPRPQKVEWDGW